MPIQEFFTAVQARFDDDTGVVGNEAIALPRLGRRLYLGFLGGRLRGTLPYVEFHSVSDETLDTFDTDLEGGTYQFSAFTSATREQQAYELRKNLIRVFDDARIAETVEGTTFRTAMFTRLEGGFGPRIVDGVYQTVLRYRILIQLTTNNPATRWS